MSDRTAFEEALHAMETEAFNFGYRGIKDAAVRQSYFQTVRQYAQELRHRVDTGELTPQQAAADANAMRNHFMDIARLRSSDIGRARAQQIKSEGLTLDALLEKYAQSKFGRAFSALSESEQNAVYLSVVEASGRANTTVTLQALRLGRLGRGLMVLSLAIAVYDVATADDKVEAAEHEAVGFGGGFLGGAAGGAVAGLACGPGAPVCVTIGVFVGGVAGALGADLFWGWLRHPH